MNRYIQFVYALLIISTAAPSIAASTLSADSPLSSLFSSFASGAISANLTSGIKGVFKDVQAASGPLDLLSIQSEINQLKKSYSQVYKLLRVDDSARLAGYIIRLDKLAIVLAQAGPVGQLTLIVAHITLAGRILNIAQRGVRLAGNGCSLAQRILGVQIAVQNARAAGITPKSILNTASGPDATTQLVNTMISTSSDLNTKLMPWVLRGGLLAPMNQAVASLNSAQNALGRINNWMPNQG